ncbi:unnamed protein product [Ascophyllum nodosum]
MSEVQESSAIPAGPGAGSGDGSGAGPNAPDCAPSPRGGLQDAAEAMKVQTIGPFPDYGGCELRLVNMTATANMGCQIDLRTVVTRARNAEYNPKRFSACVVRLINSKEPKATALIFKTGKIVVTGAKSAAAVDYACSKFAAILRKLGAAGGGTHIRFNAKTDIKVQNMVATTDVGFPIRMEGLQNKHSSFINYEPELFPGLIYRLAEPKICLLIFVSGKVVLTGAKSAQQLEEAFKKMYPLLLEVSHDSYLVPTAGGQQRSTDVTEQARKKRRT